MKIRLVMILIVLGFANLVSAKVYNCTPRVASISAPKQDWSFDEYELELDRLVLEIDESGRDQIKSIKIIFSNPELLAKFKAQLDLKFRGLIKENSLELTGVLTTDLIYFDYRNWTGVNDSDVGLNVEQVGEGSYLQSEFSVHISLPSFNNGPGPLDLVDTKVSIDDFSCPDLLDQNRA